MKILLAAVNAKFNHTNIAVRSLAKYAGTGNVIYSEWTINMNIGEILRGIEASKADMVIFSTYIWNSEIIRKLIPEVKKVLPAIKLAAGGPEAGFNAEVWLNDFPQMDFIMTGEGEDTLREISKGFDIKIIKGIWYRNEGNEICFTGDRPLICNMDSIPFPYDDFDDPDHRIYYYESSRGCPFSCAYCMSSLDKRVRFRSLEQTCRHIQTFLDANVSLVKFVDRTYNLNEERYLAIWQYILDHHNGKTMFHFEIEAEFLSEKALAFLQNVPEGIMQFEIGVQSCNPLTLDSVGRSKETIKLFENIRRIPKSIHTHLDLIAGLPYEDLESFGASFEKVMELRPDALQLGFLKVLHGTTMESIAKTKGWQWMDNPPYEVISSPWMTYSDIIFLKDVEVILDAFYNSGIFTATINYLSRINGWKRFFFNIATKARTEGVLDAARKTTFWFDWLAECIKEDETAIELLKFDYLRMGKTSRFPSWLKHNYDKAAHLDAMNKKEKLFDDRIEFAFSEYDVFSVNPFAEEPEKTKGAYKVLFVYARHNSLIKNSQIILQ